VKFVRILPLIQIATESADLFKLTVY